MGMRHSNVGVGFCPDKSCMHIGRGALTESTLRREKSCAKNVWVCNNFLFRSYRQAREGGGEQMEQRRCLV